MLKGEEGFRQRPIVPGACAPSIVGAEAFHDRVRDGYGWADLARVTGNPLRPFSGRRGGQAEVLKSTEWRTRGCARASSAIRTGRLSASRRVHPRPIQVVVCDRPYPADPVGGLVSGPASRLDAVSASPSRTSAAGRRRWHDDPHTGGPSAPVLSYWGRPPSSLLRPRWIETELSHDVLNPARVPL